MGEFRARLERPNQGAAQQRNLHEIVEVPGLKRGVLSVVGEAEQLSSVRRHGGVPA
jgi:hypothetical protein